MGSFKCRKALLSALIGAAYIGSAAFAADQSQPTYQLDIPTESLSKALKDFSIASSQQIIFSERDVANRNAPALHGGYTRDQALAILLAGTDLHVEVSGSGVLMIRKKKEQAVPSSGATDLVQTDIETVTVTGTRIRGSSSTSPVITITSEAIRESGFTNVGDVARSIPQNFAGGQNPGIVSGGVKGLNNQNITGASSIDLRGLGPDATLTLLDGKRLAYNGYAQAVDVSEIPVAALDRIEILTDGASAIYGSDAVGGVANIILKPDYDGLSTSARIGTATDGGDTQQQYDVVGGMRWDTGGFLAAYNYEKASAIYSSARDYTSYMPNPYMLLPRQEINSAVVTAHQDVDSLVTLKLDALYGHRNTYEVYTIPPYGFFSPISDESYSISGTASFHLPDEWAATISGVYGKDQAELGTIFNILATNTTLTYPKTCYCNTVDSVEFESEGPLFQLSGGDARLAFGAGRRESGFNQHTPQSVTADYRRHDTYGYGELLLPLASSDMGIPLVDGLSVDAALRYEDYSTFGAVTTPKAGVIYQPTDWVDIKGSWGKSFKAPTLQQQYAGGGAYLYNASAWGAVGYPSSATFLMVTGASPNLTAEKADTWSVTTLFHPEVVKGLRVGLSYFEVNYRGRIVQPITNPAQTFTNAAYRQFFIYTPTATQLANAIGHSVSGLSNYSGAAYDPSKVIALVNNSYTNATAESAKGLDIDASYSFSWHGNVSLSSSSSFLYSHQRTTASSPEFDLAGTIYNPPHFRSRNGVTWETGHVVASIFGNFIGGVLDNRSMPNVSGDPMTTFDANLIYHLPVDDGALKGVDLTFTALNIADRKPPFLKPPVNTYENYDSTNYPSMGRFIGLTITKQW